MSKRWQTKETTRIVKVGGYAARLLMAVIISLAPVGLLPTGVQADDSNPVDLELHGEGATPWSISNIEPGDSGTKTVELHNVGTQHGFVTIWISDMVSSEGMNPESETGNTAEPGELNEHLLVNLTADGLNSNLDLPTAINNLPQNSSGPDYIEVIPLKAGDTVDLLWDWELPTGTGNDVQGDAISFTINYLLREFIITDVSEVVTEDGIFTENVTVVSDIGEGNVTIKEDTVGKTEEGEPLSEIWIIKIDIEPSAPSVGTTTVGAHYDCGPYGTTFDQPVTITLTYDPNDIPERASEWDLVVALWDENAGEWVKLEGFTIDAVNNTISVPVTHFSRYTIISPVPVPPPPPPPPAPEPVTPPPPPPAPEPPTRTRLLEVDMLGKTGAVKTDIDGTVGESLRLTDPGRSFIIDVDRGTRITGADGVALSRIELTITEEPIEVPDNTVVLSSIYRVTGYTQNMEISRINFDPSAKLTILYDPRDLPENAFPPFIATYTDELGLVQLEPPPDAVFEVGKAKALISHALLFAVMAELAPPPPPLPATFEVSNLTINPGLAELGQPVVISLTIANEGAVTGSYELYLIVDGIVRAVKEITLAGQSIEIISFEVSNSAAGKHQVKIAGLTGEFRIIHVATVLPAGVAIDWFFTDLSVGSVIAAGLLALFLVIRRSQRLPLSNYSIGSIVKALRHKKEGQS